MAKPFATMAQSNKLSMARYSFSLIEKRCLYIIIHEVRKQYKGSDSDHNFSNMIIQIPQKSLSEIAEITKDAYQALEKLINKTIEVENNGNWIHIHWVLDAKYRKEKKIYEVEISHEIMPYLVNLSSNFTTYNASIALTLKSIYSQRIYEFCCQYQNRTPKTFFLSVDQLRTMLKIDDKKGYENITIFKNKVLNVAQKEIKSLFDKGECEFHFTYCPKETKGRKILSFFFFLHTKEQEQGASDYGTAEQQKEKIMSMVKITFSKNTDFQSRVQEALEKHPQMVLPILKKISKKVLDYPQLEIAPVVKFMLSEDFNIK